MLVVHYYQCVQVGFLKTLERLSSVIRRILLMFDFNINDSQYRAFTLYKNKKYEHYTCKERNILRFK